MIAIETRQLTKCYGEIKAVDGLNLRVEEGSIYGFIGPNGAGKSTTIRMLMGFLRQDAGEMRLMGFHPKKDRMEIQRVTGYVPAEAHLYEEMTVSQLLHFTQAFYKLDCKPRIDMLAQCLELEMDKKFRNLSFGNRKKVSVACALLPSPKLLVLDEPTNGLDPVIRTRLYDLLLEENRRGMTVFFSSHVLGEVQKVCTRVALMKDGRIVKEDSMDNLRGAGACRVRVTLAKAADFAKLPGVSRLCSRGTSAEFLYSGDINLLLKALACREVQSLHIEEPELEEVFFQYYGQAEGSL